MERLPNDVILRISGFYGSKIPSALSEQINQQKILCAIKENEYYKDEYRIWNIKMVLNKLLDNNFVPERLREMVKNSAWKDWNKIVNKIWWSFNLQERQEIIDKHFSHCSGKHSCFITGNGFINSKINFI